jgi:hypothetical protein
MLIFVPAVQAQGTCTMETASGTYAFEVQGASTAILGPSAPPWILHWDAKYAPLALVGMITLQKDGIGQGFWWQINGTANGGLTPVTFELTTLESYPDCTGVFEYSFTFGGQAHTNREWFVLLNNGRELRGVSQAGGLPTGTWHTTAHRVSNGVAPVTTFGQKNMKGDYLLSVNGLLPIDPPPPMAFRQAALMRFHVSDNGDFTGTWHGKIGPAVAVSDVSGHFTINPDGTFDASLNVAAAPGVTSIAKGVLFDEGKSGYLIPLTNLVEGAPSIPQMYGLGELTRIGP